MRKIILGLFVLLALAACNGLPPTVVVVVTSTPDPKVIQVTVTPSNAVAGVSSPSGAPTQVSATNPTNALPTATPLVLTVAPPATQVPPATTGPSATPNLFPTETRAQVYIAQQDFEHGFMFWVSNAKVIWVLYTSSTDPNTGEWHTFPDTWVDGTDPETDPSITPPSADRYQPRRGFGKLWRTDNDLRGRLGWGVTPEFALNTTYVYVPGGSMNGTQWVPGPGTHYITALSRQTFALTQSPNDANSGTWKRVP